MSKHNKTFYELILENYNLGKHNPRFETDYDLQVPGRTYLESDSSTSIGINPRRIFQGKDSFLKRDSKYPQSENALNTKGYINRGLSQSTDPNQLKQIELLDFVLGHETGHVLPTSVDLLPEEDPRKIKFNELDKEIPQKKEGKADLRALAFWKAIYGNFPVTVNFPEDTSGFNLIERQIELFRKKNQKGKP